MPGQSIFLKINDKSDKSPAGPDAVDRFLEKATGRPQGVGRLIFALDATASRGPTWDMARGLTGDMIREAARIGRLEMQLVYFGGGADGPAKCVASNWMTDPAALGRAMARVECEVGYTQIRRALAHAQREAEKAPVGAVVLIGDACEPVNDGLDQVAGEAARLGKLKTPVFAFLEGTSSEAEKGFQAIAKASGGAFGRFDAGGVKRLGELLQAAAIVAVGGVAALENRSDEASRLLLGQMKRDN